MSEAKKELNIAIEKLDAKEVKRILLENPEIDIMDKENNHLLTIQTMFFVINDSSREEDIKRKEPLLEVLKVLKENSNFILFSKLDKMSNEDLKTFLEKDGLSNVSYKIFEKLLSDIEKLDILIKSKYNKLSKDKADKINNSKELLLALKTQDVEVLSKLIKKEKAEIVSLEISAAYQSHVEKINILSNEMIELLEKEGFLNIKETLMKNFDEYEILVELFNDKKHLITEEMIHDLLALVVKFGEDKVFNFIIEQEVLKVIDNSLIEKILSNERYSDKLIKRLIKDSRINFEDPEAILDTIKSIKAFDFYMESDILKNYCEEQDKLFKLKIKDVYRDYKEREKVKNKFKDF